MFKIPEIKYHKKGKIVRLSKDSHFKINILKMDERTF